MSRCGMGAVAIGIAVGVTGCYDTGPHLDGVQPASAHHFATVTLTGSHLCGDSGACAGAAGEVRLGLGGSAVRMPVTSYGDDTITISVPEVARVGASHLIVTVNDMSSNAVDFEVLGDPARP